MKRGMSAARPLTRHRMTAEQPVIDISIAGSALCDLKDSWPQMQMNLQPCTASTQPSAVKGTLRPDSVVGRKRDEVGGFRRWTPSQYVARVAQEKRDVTSSSARKALPPIMVYRGCAGAKRYGLPARKQRPTATPHAAAETTEDSQEAHSRCCLCGAPSDFSLFSRSVAPVCNLSDGFRPCVLCGAARGASRDMALRLQDTCLPSLR